MKKKTEEKSLLVILVEQSGLEKTQAEQIKEIFVPFLNEIHAIEKDISNIDASNPSKQDMIIAREIRIRLKDNRVASEKVRKESKADILIKGRLIDSIAGVIENTSKLLEQKLQNIEDFAENQEKIRIDAVKNHRLELLKPFGNTEAFINLGEMPSEQWEKLFEGVKYADAAMKEKARNAEEERIEKERLETKERERIWMENARLKAEAEERERLAKEEREKFEQERLKLEQKMKAEREAAEKEANHIKAENEAKAKAECEAVEKEQARLKEEADKKLKAEQEKAAKEKTERERLEAEIAAKKAEEEKHRKAIELAEKKAKAAPDKDKIAAYIKAIIEIPKPKVSTPEANAIMEDIAGLLIKVQDFSGKRLSEI